MGTVAATVDLMATSSTLAVTHNLVLRTVRLNPPALPTPQGTAAGVLVISPVTRFEVSVVVANEGSVDERRASVRVSLANQTTGATDTRTLTAAVALGSTVGLPPVSLRGQAGNDVRAQHFDRPAARADLHRWAPPPRARCRSPRRLEPDLGLGRAAPARGARVDRPHMVVIGSRGIEYQGLEGLSRGREHHDHGQSQWGVH